MSDGLHDVVLRLIPSESLKQAINEQDYRFSDIALLSTVFYCSENYDTRIAHLQLLSDHFTGEIKAYTERIIENQKEMLAAFMEYDNSAIYELCVKEAPWFDDERFLCGSFEAALKMIQLLWQEYDYEDESLLLYRIVKRPIYRGREDETFSEGDLGEVVLRPDRTINTVVMNGYSAEECDGFCIECSRDCIHCSQVPYVRFLKNLDPVKYRTEDGMEKYGVVFQDDENPTAECYIVPLDTASIRDRDFENASCDHEHVPAFFVERLTAQQLPEHLQEGYLAYIDDWRKG